MRTIIWFLWRNVAKAIMALLRPELAPMLKEVLKEQDLLRVRKVDWTDLSIGDDGKIIVIPHLMKKAKRHAKESIASEDEQLKEAGADLVK